MLESRAQAVGVLCLVAHDSEEVRKQHFLSPHVTLAKLIHYSFYLFSHK